MTDTPTDAARASSSTEETEAKGATLAVVSAATALVLIVFTVPLTTLTVTAGALGAGPGGQAWILSAMSVGAAAALLASGAVGDDYGRRRAFVAGTVLLAIASVFGALAPNAIVLVLVRVAQGIGGAAIIACGLGLVAQAYPGKALVRASGIWAASLGAGVAVGPILASGLVTLAGWTAPYWFAAAAAALIALSARLLLAESAASEPRPIDLAGTVLLGAGMAGFLAGLTQSRAGWDQPLVYILLAGGLALLAGFFAAERMIAHPMLDIRLFRRPDFVAATVAALASGAGVLSIMSLIPTILERAMGVTTLTAAFVLLAWSATTAVSAFAARWLRVSPRALLVGGLAGCAAGQFATYGFAVDSSVLRLLPGMLVAGAANGILNAALGREAVASVPPDRSAMGSGANNTARYLGSATGLTICAVLITHAGASSGVADLFDGWNQAVLVTTAFSLLGAVFVFFSRNNASASQTQPQS